MELKEAVKRFKNAAGDAYQRPDKRKSTFERDGWFLVPRTADCCASCELTVIAFTAQC